ncbi:hypothetical protein TNCT_305171 [Trichonephila clavata]|uniref:Uncharacterized protein n=1 Tax=Trichonephila clavata TaxID=2740835 RepID=A0A8X6GHD9_TRICU|nr:hypothetical protein TNCT_305171 [Trichonephila clavata]
MSMVARRCLLAEREDVQETNLSEFQKNAAKCEWLRLVGNRLLLLHSPQETGLTLIGGRSRSCASSNPK